MVSSVQPAHPANPSRLSEGSTPPERPPQIRDSGKSGKKRQLCGLFPSMQRPLRARCSRSVSPPLCHRPPGRDDCTLFFPSVSSGIFPVAVSSYRASKRLFTKEQAHPERLLKTEVPSPLRHFCCLKVPNAKVCPGLTLKTNRVPDGRVNCRLNVPSTYLTHSLPTNMRLGCF